MTPLQTAFALGLPLATFGIAGAGLVTAGRRERKLVGERIASVRPGTTAMRARTRRAAAAGHGPFAAPILDPLFGIDRHVASDEAMPLVAPLVALALAAAATLGVLTWLFGLPLPPMLPVGLGAGVIAGRSFVGSRRDGIHRRMEDEFALALGVITRCVRAGLPVTEGMRAVAAEVSAPTGPEFRRCVDQVQLGQAFEDALGGLAARCALPDYRFFAVSVTLQRQTGGNLAETLENLSETIRKRKAVRLKAQALTAETRMTVLVLAVLPIVVSAVMMLINPDYVMQLFSNKSGKALLGAAVVSQYIGLFVIRTVVRKSLA